MADHEHELEQLVHAHSREVYGLLLAITRNSSTAEELTQEVFIVAMKQKKTGGEAIRPWLRGVARFLALNELRRKRPHSAGDESALNLLCQQPLSSKEDRSDFDEEVSALQTCLKTLKDDDRLLLARRYEKSIPLESIAQKCGQSSGYIKQRLFRLRKRLAECIRRRLGETGVAHA